MKNPSSITIIARRWFQRTYGNTYHSVTVVNGDTGESFTNSFEYGYGDHYLQTAGDLIESAGWLNVEREEYLDGGKTPVRIWVEDMNDCNLIQDVADVPRKKDL